MDHPDLADTDERKRWLSVLQLLEEIREHYKTDLEAQNLVEQLRQRLRPRAVRDA